MFDMDLYIEVFAKVRGMPLTKGVSECVESPDGLRFDWAVWGKGGVAHLRGIRDMKSGAYFPANLFTKAVMVDVVCPFYSGNEVSNFLIWDLTAGDCPSFPAEWGATVNWAEKCFGNGGGVEYRVDGCAVPLEKILEFQGMFYRAN